MSCGLPMGAMPLRNPKLGMTFSLVISLLTASERW
jgi:hypothetical protein